MFLWTHLVQLVGEVPVEVAGQGDPVRVPVARQVRDYDVQLPGQVLKQGRADQGVALHAGYYGNWDAWRCDVPETDL